MEVRFSANIRDLERELKRLQNINARAAQQMAADHKRAAQQAKTAWSQVDLAGTMQRQMASLGPMLKSYGTMIAGMFAGREALAAAETWTRFSNSLKVAGLSGQSLTTVQEALYQSAIKNGTALEPLGQLYSRLAQSAGALGASQSQMLQFSNGVTAALRVQGGSAEEASGALLQMSQALAGGIVHAEEFNSINEGARPILQAVANGNAAYGGSVTKLRAAMLAGKLTSKDFFDSFLAGSASLESQAAKAPLTVAASMTNLHTALTRYIGTTDAALGGTERMAAGIGYLSENLDTVAQSLLIVGGLYASTYLPALGRAGAAMAVSTAATIRDVAASGGHTASLITRAAAMNGVSRAAVASTLAVRGFSAAMATATSFLGGPVGIAITALTVGLGYLAVSSTQAAVETEKLERSIQSLTEKRKEAEAAETKAKIATDTMSSAQRSALEKTAKLTGQVGLLATEYGRLAVEAKRAALAQAGVQYVKANSDFLAAKEVAMSARPRNARGESAESRARREEEWKNSPEYQRSMEAYQNRQWSLDEYRRIRKQDANDYKPTPTETPDPKTNSGGGSKARDNSAASARAIEQAESAYRDAVAASAKTAAERYTYALQALDADKRDAIAQADQQSSDKRITVAAADQAKALAERTYTQKKANLDAARAEELEQIRRDQAAAAIDLGVEANRLDADRLQSLAQFARTLDERQSYERQALAAQQKADDAAFKQGQDQLALDREKAGWTKAEIDRLRQIAEANRSTQKRNETGDLERQQGDDRRGRGGIGQQVRDYAERNGSLEEQFGRIATRGLDDITNGITDAITGAKSLQEAFSDMAKSIIADLVQMAVKFVVLEAIGAAFGVKGLGKASLGKSSTGPAKNAKGTNSFGGGLSMVGEKGPELVYMPRGAQVVPNNLLSGAMRSGAMAGSTGSGTNISFATTVHAEDAVLTSWVREQITQSQVQSVAMAQKLTSRNNAARQQNRLVR